MINIDRMEDTPVWVINDNCKGCDICVSVCPAGVLVMHDDNSKTLGKISLVENPDSCIGCKMCQEHCPDFAIFVAERTEYKFSRISDESKNRQQSIIKNNFKSINR